MTDKAIRVLAFTGKKNDWTMWEAKYKARARTKGWLNIMDGSVVAPDATATLTAQADIDKRDKNDEGYSDLLLSMNEEISFGLVNEAKTNELPDGDLALA